MSAQRHQLPWVVDAAAAPQRWDSFPLADVESSGSVVPSAAAGSGTWSLGSEASLDPCGSPLPRMASGDSDGASDGGGSSAANADATPHWGYVPRYYSQDLDRDLLQPQQQQQQQQQLLGAPAAALSLVGSIGRRALRGLQALAARAEDWAEPDAMALPRTAQQADSMEQQRRAQSNAFMDLDPIHGYM